MVKQQKSSKNISKKKSVVKTRNVANKKSIESHGFAFFNSDEYRERIRTIKVNFLLMKLRFGIKVKKIINFLNFKAQQEITFLRDSWMPITVKPFLVFQGLAVFALFIALADFLIPPVKLDKSLVLQTSVTKQITNVVAGGSPVKWTSLVRRGDITDGKYLLTIPKSAQNIKIKTIDNNQAESILNSPTQDITSLEKKKNIAKSNQPRSLFIANVANSMKKLMLSSVEVAVQSIVDASNEQVQEVENVKVVDLSSEAITPPVEDPIIPEVIEPTPELAEPIVETIDEAVSEEVLDEPTISDLPDITETTSPSDEPVVQPAETEEQPATPPVPADAEGFGEAMDQVVAVTYETPAPQITEQETDNGKLVTVSSDTELLNSEGEVVPLTDVLAFTNIPEIYKVGQENKIKIKWTNPDCDAVVDPRQAACRDNGYADVTFHAYDTNNNGKLDYVEWTVPHLSTQTFEIIFISKAFLLDPNKEILEDIYDTVKNQDNTWVSITSGQYVRVTFEKTLTNQNDITVYAKPTNPNSPAQIKVYATDTDQLVTTIYIDKEGTFKELIPNLATPTDQFDLQIVGDVDVDYIVDPTGNYALNINGADSYVTLPITGVSNAITVSAWVKNNSSSVGVTIGNYSLDGFRLITTGKLGVMQIRYNSVDYSADLTFSNDGNWHHLVGTWDGEVVKVYQDGVVSSDTPATPEISLSIDEYYIGITDNLGSSGTSIYDDVTIFSRALSAYEVSKIYNNGLGLYGNINMEPFSSGLVAGYHFDEGEGSAVTDFSGNENNGTIYSSNPGSCYPESCGLVNGCSWNISYAYCNDDRYFYCGNNFYDEESCNSYSSGYCSWNGYYCSPVDCYNFYDETSCNSPGICYWDGSICYQQVDCYYYQTYEECGWYSDYHCYWYEYSECTGTPLVSVDGVYEDGIVQLSSPKYWVGSTSSWNDTNNWSATSGGAGGAGVPDSTSIVIFDSADTTDCNIDIDVSVFTIDIKSGYTGSITQTGAYTITSPSIIQIDGTLTLINSNNIMSGISLLGGTLNINGASAIGTGSLTIAGGTIDNTSGSSVTLPNTTISLNGDFTFTGTNSLNFGGGTTTIGANRVITVTANDLTIEGAITSTYDLTKNGAGGLILSGTSSFSDVVLNAGNLTLGSTLTADTFTQNGGTFNAGSGDITIDGNFTITDGTSSLTSGALDVSGIFSNAGTFNGGSGDITIDGNLAITAGEFTSTSGSLTVSGDFTNSATFVHNSGTVILAGESDLNTNGDLLNNLEINNTTYGSGGALSFDGSDDYVAIARSTLMEPAAGDNITLSVWVKTTASGWRYIFDKMTTYGYQLLLQSGTGKVVWEMRDTSNKYAKFAGTSAINNGNWHNIVAMRNGTSFSIFVDGILENTITTNVLGSLSSGNPARIGRQVDGTNYPFSGQIDEFLMFNRSLNSTEVSQLYNSGNGLYADTSIAPFNSGLVAGYHFDEGTGTTATDITGNNNGTLTNGPTWVGGVKALDILPGTFTLSSDISLVGNLTIAEGRTISLGSNSITLSGDFINNGTLDAGTGTVTLASGTHTITGSNTFNNLVWSPSNTITFPASATQTISGTLTCEGTEGNVITINSSSSGTPATLSKASGTVNCDYLSLKDSTATGGATWEPGINSINVSGNTGWFNATPNVPTLVSPVNASYTNDNTPTLSANYSDSDTGDTGTTNYRISSSSLVDCTNNTNVVAWGTSSATATNNESTTWTKASSIGNDGTYYWCAQNDDGRVTSVWTQMGSFVLDTTAPTTPGTPSTSPQPNDTTPTWTWSASTDTGGSGLANPKYTVQWCGLSNFTGCSSNTATTNTESYTHSTALDGGTWYFRVKATDVANNPSSWSSNGVMTIFTTCSTDDDCAFDNYCYVGICVANSGGGLSMNPGWTQTSPYNSTSVTALWIKSDSANLIDQEIQFYSDGNCINASGSLIDLSSNSVETQAFTGTDGSTYSYVIISAYDNADPDVSACSSAMVIDTTAPLSVSSDADGLWHTSAFDVTLNCTDATSGCDKVYYCINVYGDPTCTPDTNYVLPGAVFNFASQGEYVLRLKGVDKAGNATTPADETNHLKLDTTAPATTIDSGDYTFGTWISSGSVTITLDCADATSGCVSTLYCTDENNICTPSLTYSSALNISISEGPHSLYLRYYSTDTASNSEAVSHQVIRMTGPVGGGSSLATSDIIVTEAPVIPTESTVPETPNIITPIVDVVDQLTKQVADIADLIVGQSTQPKIVYPPIEEAVPEEPQMVFQGGNIISQKEFNKINILPLPESIKDLAIKFPSFASTLESVGVSKTEDIEKLKVVSLRFPSLSEVTEVSSIISIQDLTKEQLSKIPSDITFARTGNENIDLNINVKIDQENNPVQSIKTLQGKPLYLSVKPDNPASSVKGYIILKSVDVTAFNDSKSIANKALASLIGSIDSAKETQGDAGKDMVLSEFDYVDYNGIWRAQTTTPLVDGTYEIKTVVSYKEKTKDNKTSKNLSMVLLVDPEGYIYEKTLNAQEMRIKNAKVSIYVLDEASGNFSLWEAKDYLQNNPQITDVTGKYSFLVPAGTYYIKVESNGYKNYQSEIFAVEAGNGIHQNIEMVQKNWILKFLTLETIMIGVAIILLLLILIILVIKFKIKKN